MNEFTQKTENCWFPRQREPIYNPADEKSLAEFKAYWRNERSRCINGFYLADGQVYVPGPLYFHTVYWKIAMYLEDKKTGKKPRVIRTPFLRDIDWEIFNDLNKCTELGKFYCLVGSRDFGKSIISASYAGWLYTFFDKSESVISGGEATYIKLATDKIEDGLIQLHPALKKQRLTSDWKKEIVAGFKVRATNLADPRSSFSSIKIRNYEMGTKTMAANGTRPGYHLIDEIGTLPNLISCVKDSDGCWWSGDGDKPSALVMLCGTGGDMEKGEDAGEIFNKPYAFNMLEFEDIWEQQGKIGKFIPATKAKLAYKEPQKLSDYLDIQHPDLEQIIILVSNEEKCLKEWWSPQHEKAKKAGNRAYLKFLAYWPLKPSDCFLRLSASIFDTEAAKRQKSKVELAEITGSYIELYEDSTGQIKHRFSKKLPVDNFPHTAQDNLDAPIVMYEAPIHNAPFGLYTAGVDSYRHDTSANSDSLGAVYIFKRTHSLLDEKMQNTIVASYVARPEDKRTWMEQARMLIEYYNALALIENDEESFITYMVDKRKEQYLQPAPEMTASMSKTTTVKRKYGIHRSSIGNINKLHTTFKDYLDQPIRKETVNSQDIDVTGISQVYDKMLLQEIIKYEGQNADRIIAAELAVYMAHYLDVQGLKVKSVDADPRYKIPEKYKTGNKNSLPFQRRVKRLY